MIEKFDLPPVQPATQKYNRSFGITWFFFLLIIGVWPFFKGAPVKIVPIAIGTVFLILGLTVPAVLTPLSRIWMKFGYVMSYVMTPLILTFFFFLILTPFSLFVRLFRVKSMQMGPDSAMSSYWIAKENRVFDPDSAKNQF